MCFWLCVRADCVYVCMSCYASCNCSTIDRVPVLAFLAWVLLRTNACGSIVRLLRCFDLHPTPTKFFLFWIAFYVHFWALKRDESWPITCCFNRDFGCTICKLKNFYRRWKLASSLISISWKLSTPITRPYFKLLQHARPSPELSKDNYFGSNGTL